MSLSLDELLSRTDKGIGLSKNLLTKLLRQIFIDMNMGPDVFKKLVKTHFDDRIRRGMLKEHDRSNLIRAVTNDAISLKNFEKVISILEPSRIEMGIGIVRSDGSATQHQTTLVLTPSGRNYDNPSYYNPNIDIELFQSMLEDYSDMEVLEWIKEQPDADVKSYLQLYIELKGS